MFFRSSKAPRIPRFTPSFHTYFIMSSDITLYSWPTPNGIKASITLEELGLPYKIEGIDISSNRQKEEYGSPPSLTREMHIRLINYLAKLVSEN